MKTASVGAHANKERPVPRPPQGLQFMAEEDADTIVQENGVMAAEEATFSSKSYGFRVHVQRESVLDSKKGFGPIAVSQLRETIWLDGEKLEGVMQVQCLPDGCRYGVPLVFNFPVPGDDKNPTMDEFGRIQYEVLVKRRVPPHWVRGPKSATSLEVIREEGRTYVSVKVGISGSYSFWKVSFATEAYKMDDIPFRQRRRHQSLVQNNTAGVDIQVYVIPLPQWNAALESAKAGGGEVGFHKAFKIHGGIPLKTFDMALFSECTTIPPGHCHWFDTPRRGIASGCSNQKAAVCIATSNDTHNIRLEAMVPTRSNRRLSVALPVENGRVRGSPASFGAGGILPQMIRVINNQANSIPRPSAAVAR